MVKSEDSVCGVTVNFKWAVLLEIDRVSLLVTTEQNSEVEAQKSKGKKERTAIENRDTKMGRNSTGKIELRNNQETGNKGFL